MVKKISTRKMRINKLWLGLILLFIVQILTIYYMANFSINHNRDSSLSLSRFINESESKRYTVPIIDVSESRVYIPEFHIFMPLNDISRKLQYSTSPSPKMNLYLSITGVIGNQISDDDPTCDKMVRISTTMDASSDETYIGEITPTQDGLRYVYQNNRKCSIYPAGASDQLADVARSIQKY